MQTAGPFVGQRSTPRALSQSPRVAGLRTREDLVRHVMGLFDRVGLVARVGADRRKLWRFVNEVSRLYRNNPYHNWAHAVDVTHTAAWMATRPVFREGLTITDRFWLLAIAVVHDVDHPGHNNQWEVQIRSPLAAKYNNVAVLEHHSLDVARTLLDRPECRFTEDMPALTQARGELLLAELVLATDFAIHNDFVAALTAVVERHPREALFGRPALALLMLKALIKAADIGNVTKPFVQAEWWAERAMQEFWAQGRMEKAHGFPVGPLNDQDRVDLFQAQIGFIRFVAMDFFTQLARIEPELLSPLQFLQDNAARYQSLRNGLSWAREPHRASEPARADPRERPAC